GPGSFDMAVRALENLQNAGFTDAKISVVMTRENISQLDEFKALADRYDATLRITRLRPSGRGADVWDDLHPLPEQQRDLYDCWSDTAPTSSPAIVSAPAPPTARGRARFRASPCVVPGGCAAASTRSATSTRAPSRSTSG